MTRHFFKTINNTIKHWYIPLIIGIIFIIVAIYTFLSPLSSYVALSVVFSLAFLFSGISNIILSIANRKEIDNWGWLLFFGIVSLIFGVLLLANPQLSMATLPFYVGFWVMFQSIGAIGHAMDLKNYGVLDWGNLMLVGVLGLLFSFILLWNPLFAGLNVVIWTGIAFLTLGIYSIYFSFKLKKVKDFPNKIPQDLKDKFQEVKTSIQNEMNK